MFAESINIAGSPGNSEAVLLNIIRAIDSSDYWYSKIPIVLAVEAYPITSGTSFEYVLRGYTDRVLVMSELGPKNGDWIPGVPKTEAITKEQVYIMQVLLSTDSIHFSSDFFCYDHTVVEIKEKLKDLFEVHQYHVEDGKEKGFHTAKVGQRQDDIMVAVLMLAYWSTRFINSPRTDYLQWRRLRMEERRGVSLQHVY